MRSTIEAMSVPRSTTGKYSVKIDAPLLKRLTGGLVGYRSPSGTEQRKEARGVRVDTKAEAIAAYAHAVSQGQDDVGLLVDTMNRKQRKQFTRNAVMHSRELVRATIGRAQKQARRAERA